MNSHYNSSGLHGRGPSVAVEPDMSPLNEPPMQGLNFNTNREQYGFQLHGHDDMLTGGIQQQQFQMQASFNNQQANHDQLPHSYQDHAHIGASCLHGDRQMGFSGSTTGHQQGFEAGFGPLTEGQGRECFSQQQQQRLATMPDFQSHSHPNGNHAVPAPCLPLDQSPNRAASFHGLPSSSPETHRLEHYRVFPQGRMPGSEYCFPCDPLSGNFDMTGFSTPDSTAPESKLPYCEMGGQIVGSNFPNINHSISGAPMISNSKVDRQLPQQSAYLERFGNREKLAVGMEPGVSARHPLVLQQRAGSVARQNPGSPALPRLYQSPDFSSSNPDMQNGGIMIHSQHSQLDYPMHRLDGHSMHHYGDPIFSVQQLAPQAAHQQQQHLSSSPFMNMAKRPRFDFSNGHAGERCGPLNSSLHNRPSMESHLSPSAFPGPMGDFTTHVTDGFPSGPPLLCTGPQQQQSMQQRQNAAMMIKQMASRNQQQRMRQPDLQQLSHHGDVTPNGMACRGPVGNVPQPNFEKKHSFHGNFETQSPHLPQENSWFPEPHQQCREASVHTVEQTQNGHSIIFRPGVTTMDMQKPIGVSQEGFVQSLHSPGIHSQFENNIGNPQQMQSPDEGAMQPNTPMDRRSADFAGAPMRRQHNFPPGGPNQQGAPQSNPTGFSTSPGNYSSHPEYLSSQRLSVNKLGALSLGNLNKASTKDSVFGQSCLAALSTACQNMIASLGAPNLNVTFNKKSQNEAKRKPGQVEQDINSNGGSGACGPGAEYFQSNASQNSQTPCSGNSNNTLAGQSGTSQMVKGEPSTLSPNNNMDSGNEGKAATVSGRGRGKRRRDSGHLSPGNFSPSCGSKPVVSPGQQGAAISIGVEGRSKTPERSLVSPSFGKPDLTTSLDSGIQSMDKSDSISPCADYIDDASPNYNNEDTRTSRTNIKCNSDNRGGYPDTPRMEQVRTPLSSSGQDEVHPLEILQAQIQLQRQQFSISEDQPLGGKTGKKADCQTGQNGDCALANCSPGAGKGSMNTIDLDSLMAEQHATWYAPGNKALIEDPGNDKRMAFWERARGQNDNKEGADRSQRESGGGADVPGPGGSHPQCLSDKLGDGRAPAAGIPSWCTPSSDIRNSSNHFGTFVAALT